MRRPGLALLALLLVVPSVAWAHPAVDLGKRLYDDLEYKKALKQFDKALKLDLTKEERTSALQYLGLCQATVNDLAGAAATFKLLLDLDPGFTLDRSSTPPKILDLFERVKSTMPKAVVPVVPQKASELTLTHVAAGTSRPGRAIELAITVDDPDHRASKVVVRYRKKGDASYSELTATGTGGKFSAQIPGMFVVIPSLEYYIAALDGDGKVLTTAATEDRPIEVAVRDETKQATPIYKRWWFWTIAGVLVIGAVTAVAVAATQGGTSGPGTTNVTVMFTP